MTQKERLKSFIEASIKKENEYIFIGVKLPNLNKP